MKLVFFLDKLNKFGYGHTNRCKQFLNIFSEKVHVEYISLENTKKILEKKYDADIIVIDSYHINYSTEKKLKNYCKLLITIDDAIKKRKFASDIIVNYAPFVKKKFYIDNCNKNCKLLLGPKYNFVRSVEPIKSFKYKKKFNLFVYFGTKKRSKLIKFILKKLEIKKIIDKIFIFGNKKKVSHEKFLDKMNKSDLLLISSGLTLQEAISKKKIIFSTYFSLNQKRYHEYYKSKKVIYDLKFFNNFLEFPLKKINEILKKKNTQKNILKRYNRIINIKNIVNPILDNFGNKVFIKEYNNSYLYNLYKLQTTKNRKYFLNTKKINKITHKNYINTFVKDENNLIFLFEINKTIIGFLKLTFFKQKYDVSIVIESKYRNCGIGSAVLRYFNSKSILPYKLTAKIKKKNIESIKAFKKAGFTKDSIIII